MPPAWGWPRKALAASARPPSGLGGVTLHTCPNVGVERGSVYHAAMKLLGQGDAAGTRPLVRLALGCAAGGLVPAGRSVELAKRRSVS
jgi:hypothetical protein